MNERLEHADLAYTAWVECGVALGGNDRLGDMVVREISAWALGGSDRLLLGVLILAVSGFRNTLKQMEYMEKRRKDSHSQKDKKQ